MARRRTFEPVRYRRDAAGRIETVDANVDDTYFATAGFGTALGRLLWSWGARGEPLGSGTPAFYGSEGCIRAAS